MTGRPGPAGETTGVAALARLLGGVAAGKPLTAATFAAEAGIARSTGFDLVRRAEAAGFVRRNANGALAQGGRLVALGHAAHGLAGLDGPAEALCGGLRDETGWTVRLWTPEDVLVLQFWGSTPVPAPHEMERFVAGRDGHVRARLALRVPAGLDPETAARTLRLLENTGRALEGFLRSSGSRPAEVRP